VASVAKRPDGRWRARYRDEGGREFSKHFPRKVDAQRWLDETTAAVVTGQYVDPRAGRVTFASYYAEWSTRQLWESTTVKAMNLAAGSVTFGTVPLGALKRSHVEQWVKSMTARELAPGTVKTRLNNVRAVLRAAVRDRVIPRDPSEDVTLPRDRRREAAMTLPSAEDVRAILGAAHSSFRPFVALAAFAGLRLGEAAGLQVGDVEFLKRSLRVQRQVQRAAGGAIEIRPPKYGSERVVFVPQELVDMLSLYVAEHRGGDEPARWLFEATAGQPPHQNTVGYQWRRACEKAGVVGVTLHDLRHFYASALIAAGCDVVTVQRALGHAKATTTLNTYAHLWPTAEDRTRAAAADLMSSVIVETADLVRTARAE
jgi:integrase